MEQEKYNNSNITEEKNNNINNNADNSSNDNNNDNNNRTQKAVELMNIDIKDNNINNELLSYNINNSFQSIENYKKSIQIEFDDSDNDNDMIIEIEEPKKEMEDEAKYKTIINLNHQDKNDVLSHSQLIKQLWDKAEQQTKLERKKLEKIHKEKMIKKALQKEKEQAEILNEQEKKKVLKELDEEDLEVIDKNLLKELNDKKEKKELKRLKKLTFKEIEEHQKIQESKELEKKININNLDILDNDSVIDSNKIKEIKYGSTQDNDRLAEFFQPSNTSTNINQDDDINIWDKLRKGSPVKMSGQSEIWSAITETAIINKPTIQLTTNTLKNNENDNDDNLEISKDNEFTPFTINITKNLENDNDFEQLVDISGSDEVNIIPQSSISKENIYNNQSKFITETKMKNNKKEVINIIPNSSKKTNLLINWLNKNSDQFVEKIENQSLDKEKFSFTDQKIEDLLENSDDILLQDKKVSDELLREFSLHNKNHLINHSNNLNEKDDEYTEENLDDNVNNYLSDDSFDLDNILPTQNETNNSLVRSTLKINEDEDEDLNIEIPKIKRKKKKIEKPIYLEDEAVESEDEELKNLGIFKDKTLDEEEDDEEENDIEIYSGDEEEISENDVQKIIELHRKQMKDKDEKDMSAIINGVTTGNFGKRKRFDDDEIGKGYDLSDDDLDIHGLRSLRKFVNSVDPYPHKRKRYKHKGALAVYGNNK